MYVCALFNKTEYKTMKGGSTTVYCMFNLLQLYYVFNLNKHYCIYKLSITSIQLLNLIKTTRMENIWREYSRGTAQLEWFGNKVRGKPEMVWCIWRIVDLWDKGFWRWSCQAGDHREDSWMQDNNCRQFLHYKKQFVVISVFYFHCH